MFFCKRSIQELHTEEKNHTKNINIPIEDTSDWNNTTAFTMDYKDATISEEALLVSVDVAEAGSEEEVEEGGIPADDYVEATIEIQKETIAVEKSTEGHRIPKLLLEYDTSQVVQYSTRYQVKCYA